MFIPFVKPNFVASTTLPDQQNKTWEMCQFGSYSLIDLVGHSENG